MKLTEKQRKWIDAYKSGQTATDAARTAGYKCSSDKAFGNIGSENLEKLGEFIKDREAILEQEDIATMTEVNKFWTSIMRDETALRSDRLRASELRARAAGGFIDKSEVKVNGGAVFIVGDDEIAE